VADFSRDTEDLDFLSDAGQGAHPSAATLLEQARTEMLDWASAALINRRPDLKIYRGKKGLRTARQDLDLHIKHLHASFLGGASQDAASYRRWFLASAAGRGLDAVAIDAGVSILAEALWRWLPPHAGQDATTRLAASFPAAKVASGLSTGYSNALVRPLPPEDFFQ